MIDGRTLHPSLFDIEISTLTSSILGTVVTYIIIIYHAVIIPHPYLFFLDLPSQPAKTKDKGERDRSWSAGLVPYLF